MPIPLDCQLTVDYRCKFVYVKYDKWSSNEHSSLPSRVWRRPSKHDPWSNPGCLKRPKRPCGVTGVGSTWCLCCLNQASVCIATVCNTRCIGFILPCGMVPLAIQFVSLLVVHRSRWLQPQLISHSLVPPNPINLVCMCVLLDLNYTGICQLATSIDLATVFSI